MERFCQEFVSELPRNGTKAAQRAGYSPNNEAAAAATASRLLKSAKIRARVEELESTQVKRIEVKADDVLRELMRLAIVDVTHAFDDAGYLKRFEDMPEDVRRTLAGLEVSELFDGQGDNKHAIGLLKKVKFYDKTRALELLGKHLKLFTDKVEHSGTVKLEDLIAGSQPPKADS
jgi:phage terminase small subunit